MYCPGICVSYTARPAVKENFSGVIFANTNFPEWGVRIWSTGNEITELPSHWTQIFRSKCFTVQVFFILEDKLF